MNSLEHWLLFMTALVVLGLVLEYWHEIPEKLAALKKDRSWKPLCLLAGAILITVGVAGELTVESFTSRGETALRQANDEISSNLNSEAARARTDASAAIERAARADERASKNEAEAARLRKVAEDERLARVEVEQEVAWRRLRKDQISQIGTQLGAFAGQQASLLFSPDDVEADDFALQIAEALNLAKWNVSEPMAVLAIRAGFVPLGTNPPIPRGVTISSTRDQAARDASDAVFQDLKAFGFDASSSPETEPGSHSVVFIFVKHRPEGAQGEAKLREEKLGKHNKGAAGRKVPARPE
ncbi:MAG: hypothetical protein ACYDCD_01890 [Candidatus Acidiferrales bacterium]